MILFNEKTKNYLNLFLENVNKRDSLMSEKEYEKELEKLKQEADEGSEGDLDKKVRSLKESLFQLKNNKISELFEQGQVEIKNYGKNPSFKNEKIDDTEGENSNYSSDPKKEQQNGDDLKDYKSSSEDFNQEMDGGKSFAERSLPARETIDKEGLSQIQTEKRVESLENSIKHLDKAIQNLVEIINNVKKEFNKQSVSDEKMDEIIKQNKNILSKLENLSSQKIPSQNSSMEKIKEKGKDKRNVESTTQKSKSPFMPKPNLPHINQGNKKFERNTAPPPPEDDDTTIPYLKPRKEKKKSFQ